MKNTLISMVDYVLENKEFSIYEANAVCNATIRYANFLTQPLQKWMFVPCGEDGEVLEYTKTPYEEFCDKEAVCRVFSKEEVAFQKAKERCLFEGFEMHELDNLDNQFRFFINDKCFWNTIGHNNNTIEDLVKHNLTLTDAALKITL